MKASLLFLSLFFSFWAYGPPQMPDFICESVNAPLARGIVLAGGGRQSVSVQINLKKKNGTFSLLKETLYRSGDERIDLTSIL